MLIHQISRFETENGKSRGVVGSMPQPLVGGWRRWGKPPAMAWTCWICGVGAWGFGRMATSEMKLDSPIGNGYEEPKEWIRSKKLVCFNQQHRNKCVWIRDDESEERCNLDLAAQMDYLETLQFADGVGTGVTGPPLLGMWPEKTWPILMFGMASPSFRQAWHCKIHMNRLHLSCIDIDRCFLTNI